jgi:hypothetical protein
MPMLGLFAIQNHQFFVKIAHAAPKTYSAAHQNAMHVGGCGGFVGVFSLNRPKNTLWKHPKPTQNHLNTSQNGPLHTKLNPFSCTPYRPASNYAKVCLTMSPTARRDLFLSLAIGVLFLLFFHLDHLVNTYTSWNDPDWLLHLFVDGGYVLIYGSIGWLALRGWRIWNRNR